MRGRVKRLGGQLISAGPDATVAQDTLTCVHCNRVTMIQPGQVSGGYCAMCHALICEACVATGRCEPFEAKLETWERKGALRRAADRQ
jgi:hypothetical protein